MPGVNAKARVADGTGQGAGEFQVHRDIARAETLPPAAFTDVSFLRRELETIFSRSWLFVSQRTSAELRDDGRSLADLVRRPCS